VRAAHVGATVAVRDVDRDREVRTMATHSKTRRAVKRLRRLARRLRDAELKKARRSEADKPV